MEQLNRVKPVVVAAVFAVSGALAPAARAEDSPEARASLAAQDFDLSAVRDAAASIKAGGATPVQELRVMATGKEAVRPALVGAGLSPYRVDVPSPGLSRGPLPGQAESSLAGAVKEGVAVAVGTISGTVGVVLGAAYTVTIIAPAFEMLIKHDNHGPGPEVSWAPFLSTFTWGIKAARIGYRAAKTALNE